MLYKGIVVPPDVFSITLSWNKKLGDLLHLFRGGWEKKGTGIDM